MAYNVKRENVDSLVKSFWKYGYMTVSRKFGTYLPEPNPVGEYNVEAIGKYKRKYVIGITLSAEDLDNPQTLSKLEYLSSRNAKYSKTRVNLFVGIPKPLLNKAKLLLTNLSEESRKNIRLIATS